MNQGFAIVVSLIAVIFCTGCGGGEQSFESAEESERDNRLRVNMRMVQVAAEHYAADHDGVRYPNTIDNDFKTYFPGGSDGNRAAFVGPVNPFSGVNEFPSLGSEADVQAIRGGGKLRLAPGEIRYTPLEAGAAYVIVGGSHDGKPLTDRHNPDQILILSNRESI